MSDKIGGLRRKMEAEAAELDDGFQIAKLKHRIAKLERKLRMADTVNRDMDESYAKRIAELEADVHAQSLAKHQAYETIKRWETKCAELEAKIKEGRGPITSWLVDEMNKVKPLQKRIAELEAELLKVINQNRSLLDPTGTLLPPLKALEQGND